MQSGAEAMTDPRELVKEPSKSQARSRYLNLQKLQQMAFRMLASKSINSELTKVIHV